MFPVKPYRGVPIHECGEGMVSVTGTVLALADPHPYVALSAPYGNASPWMLRKSILESLVKAQARLQQRKAGWKILLTDAYRPNAVQAFMVEREYGLVAIAAGMNPKALSDQDRAGLAEKVFRVWGIPSDDPKTPPPHSTGAAFDCTLIDESGREVDMGSPIDENSDRSMPNYFIHAADAAGQAAHANRVLLNEIMRAEGLTRLESEWWHFSRGDQLAVWAKRDQEPEAVAVYGRADLIAAPAF